MNPEAARGAGASPRAPRLEATIGPAAAVVGVGLAIALTLGNMNAYVAALAALGAIAPVVILAGVSVRALRVPRRHGVGTGRPRC